MRRVAKHCENFSKRVRTTSGPSITQIMRIKVDLDKLDVDGGYVDVSRWFSRYELFFDCQLEDKKEEGKNVIDKKSTYLKYLPLYLTGSALLCYEELLESERKDYGIVKDRLSAFHRIDRSTAYASFISSTYIGNGVDLFIAELRRYLGVLGIAAEDANVLILEQFLRSIPASSAAELRSRCSKDSQPMVLENVISVARHLPSLQLDNQGSFVGAFHGHRRAGKGKGKGHPQPEESRKPQQVTYQNKTDAAARKLKCFLCDSENHKMSECPMLSSLRKQGNGVGPVFSASTLGPQSKAVQH